MEPGPGGSENDGLRPVLTGRRWPLSLETSLFSAPAPPAPGAGDGAGASADRSSLTGSLAASPRGSPKETEAALASQLSGNSLLRAAAAVTLQRSLSGSSTSPKLAGSDDAFLAPLLSGSPRESPREASPAVLADVLSHTSLGSQPERSLARTPSLERDGRPPLAPALARIPSLEREREAAAAEEEGGPSPTTLARLASRQPFAQEAARGAAEEEARRGGAYAAYGHAPEGYGYGYGGEGHPGALHAEQLQYLAQAQALQLGGFPYGGFPPGYGQGAPEVDALLLWQRMQAAQAALLAASMSGYGAAGYGGGELNAMALAAQLGPYAAMLLAMQPPPGHASFAPPPRQLPRNRLSGSRLLAEFRSNRAHQFELRTLLGSAVEFAQDQHGSRFIQEKLCTASREDVAALFVELLPSAPLLLVDQFANYVVQKFFDRDGGAIEVERASLLALLEGRMLELSRHKYGCRVVQKVLDATTVSRERKMRLVAELEGNMLDCVYDSNANHVAQKVIQQAPTALRVRLLSELKGQGCTLSQNAYGCRVVQRILEVCPREEMVSILGDDLLQQALTLSRDCFGNYTIQHLITKGTAEDKAALSHALGGHWASLSRHKFASNVVERAIEYLAPEDLARILDELLFTPTAGGQDPLLDCMLDSYSNYVLQRVFAKCPLCTPGAAVCPRCALPQRLALLKRMRKHLPAVRRTNSTFGKQIIATIERTCAALGLALEA